MTYTFKNFLEAHTGLSDPRVASPVDNVELAMDIINEQCSDCAWMVTKKTPFWRGDTSDKFLTGVRQTGFAVTDSSVTVRKSENTSNFYTVILDNIEGRSDFPKRSRSFIASTDQARAGAFGGWNRKENLLALIPFNGTKIGFVNANDMWDTEITMYGRVETINEWNYGFDTLGISADWEAVLEFDRLLKLGDKSATERFRQAFPTAPEGSTDFLEALTRAYSARGTGHTSVATSALTPAMMRQESEVWLGGQMLVVTHPMWLELTAGS